MEVALVRVRCVGKDCRVNWKVVDNYDALFVKVEVEARHRTDVRTF